MLKEIKYLLFLSIIFFFIFFTTKYYFSNTHKKKSYRSLTNINKKIQIYSQDLPILEDDTKNIIEYIKNNQTKKNQKYYFWELLNKDEK
tara:strand:+ start:624 stop:890 length:267 start_codon:yes stop_codon:yes gene_type:complete